MHRMLRFLDLTLSGYAVRIDGILEEGDQESILTLAARET